ncbi:hypothetical protein CDAR_38361 [Caerostris darwini]|uniref:Uncharacterized protein n=1 Tax=Caerostris darwini TaxID=1538125 RepID=A0AAV4N429_9ARAC|nr:hypothetical protein CDAR_38361 [Caerostris darwini]
MCVIRSAFNNPIFTVSYLIWLPLVAKRWYREALNYPRDAYLLIPPTKAIENSFLETQSKCNSTPFHHPEHPYKIHLRTCERSPTPSQCRCHGYQQARS